MERIKSVLLVDDNEVSNLINRKLIEILKVAEKVEIVHDGAEALELLTSRISFDLPLPDMIFLDINMPVMNGFEFLDNYRQMYGHLDLQITIHLLTSSISHNDYMQYERNADIVSLFLEKPMTKDTLNQALDQYHLKRLNQSRPVGHKFSSLN